MKWDPGVYGFNLQIKRWLVRIVIAGRTTSEIQFQVHAVHWKFIIFIESLLETL